MTERDSAPVTGTSEGDTPSDPSAAPGAGHLNHDDAPTGEVNLAGVGEANGSGGEPTDGDHTEPAGSRRNGRRVQRPVAVRPVRAPISGLRQRMESTAALRRSLDAKEAEALDLRASIDRLRQELDGESGSTGATTTGQPVSSGSTAARASGAGVTSLAGMAAGTAATGVSSPSGPTTDDDTDVSPAPEETAGTTEGREVAGRRRRTLVWVLIAAAVTLLLLLLLSRCAGNVGSTSVSSTASGQGSPAAVASPGPSAADQQPAAGPAPSVSPMAWPSGPVMTPPGLPSAGPGLTEAGSHLEVAVDNDGSSLDVYESLVLPAPRTDPLVLALPTLPNDVQPTLADVQVELDGTPVAVTGTPDTGLSASLPNSGAYTKAVVRYRLAGAVVARQPAAANRAGGVVLPLTAALSQAANSPVQVRVDDPHVLSVECPTVDLADRLCAAPKDGVWTAVLPPAAQRAVVYLLLDTSK